MSNTDNDNDKVRDELMAHIPADGGAADLREPGVTVDGGDYGNFLAAFEDVVMQGIEPTMDYYFFAPATNCSFSLH